jgi:hypothetical protein
MRIYGIAGRIHNHPSGVFLDAVRHRIYARTNFVEFVTWEASNMCKSRILPSFALAIVFTVSVGPARLWAQADAAKPDAAKPDAAAPKPDAAAPKPDAAAPKPDAPAPAPAPNAAAAQPAEAPTVNADLKRIADDFFHYASIGRYDLAKAEGEKIIAANGDPMEVYKAFQASVEDRNRRVNPDRRIELYERILSWQRQPDLKDVGAKLISIFNQATYKQRSNTGFIEAQVQRLSGGPRAYALAVDQLKTSGELAVPVMLNYLRDPSKRELQVPIRNALRDMGVKSLNPLLAATDMKDPVVLTWVISALGDLGYDNAVPYLVRLMKANDTPDAVKDAARQSLIRLNVTNAANLDPAQLFFELAEKFYYEKASVQPERGTKEANIWSYTDQGLVNKVVPAATFNEDMTLRECEYCLKLNAARGDAVSLWICAGYKRESEIPEGQPDTFWEEKHPATHYYAVASGTAHLNPALARALRDQNSAVALRAIRSLNEIVGATNLFAGDESPLIEGLRYSDRQVRIESALAIAQALPQKNFPGQERVIPILAEAISQTGKPGVLILAPTDKINQLREQLKNYAVAGGSTPEAAASAGASLSAVDVILMFEGVSSNIEQMFTITSHSLRLERAAKVIVAKTSKVASPYAQIAINNSSVTVTDPNIDEAALNAAIEDARKRSSGLAMDEKMATGYALRAAEMLQRLAISKGQVFDLLVAQPAVMAALDDARPEIAHAAANSLGLLNSREAQAALATKAMDEKTPDEFKIILLKDLSVHAKFYGNMLDQTLIESLGKLAESAANLDVKSAAAEALGALNLRSEQIKVLIVNQAR